MSAAAACATAADAARAAVCRDGEAAPHLKLISIFTIFATSMVGMSSPVLVARFFKTNQSLYNNALVVIKCFAAGVILATSLVHVMPDAFDALADCHVATKHPWKDFPFAGLVTLIGTILALLVDVAASSHVEHHVSYKALEGVEEEKELVGDGYGGCDDDVERVVRVEEEVARLKQRLVSRVLEIGIIFHSVIIGVTMGMSQNVCTIRPLVAALAFHQIFEGMGLGGCVAQAGFRFGTMAYMCLMFSVTTPMGIILGMILFSATGYDDSNPNALIMEGLLGSLSSGILIYMALVDLIALDFFHNKLMTSNLGLKKVSFLALTLGSASMSLLALWA
ncbi:Zinc transporter 6, chloroplastic [Stylosanthes scabra]|uniref:Zinc transporter 6, chloroplastic n=1 Tax=Stylosanthes scabra TaxID=79078 RepID=A0ABU6S644_9FABA|nr:Zinc transporter 6, chloroplastic [Stylosanthes scabra]